MRNSVCESDGFGRTAVHNRVLFATFPGRAGQRRGGGDRLVGTLLLSFQEEEGQHRQQYQNGHRKNHGYGDGA